MESVTFNDFLFHIIINKSLTEKNGEIFIICNLTYKFEDQF